MRTTLDIEDDVLQAVKERARQEHTTAGKVLSDLARKGLTGRSNGAPRESSRLRNGVPVIPSRGEIITLEQIQKIMDEDDI